MQGSPKTDKRRNEQRFAPQTVCASFAHNSSKRKVDFASYRSVVPRCASPGDVLLLLRRHVVHPAAGLTVQPPAADAGQ